MTGRLPNGFTNEKPRGARFCCDAAKFHSRIRHPNVNRLSTLATSGLTPATDTRIPVCPQIPAVLAGGFEPCREQAATVSFW
jgi:hypothetical protein